MADLSKILQQESEGIMFPFRTGVQTTTTQQQVYDSATNGIMTVEGKQYTGPTATVQYGTAEEGYPRMLREIEQGELPQFKQEDFPKAGEGIMQPSTPVTQPVEPTPTEPEAPAIDPCPPGYELINGVCQPIQKKDTGRDKPVYTGPKISAEGVIEGYTSVLNRTEGATGPLNSAKMLELEKTYGPEVISKIGEINNKYANRGVQIKQESDAEIDRLRKVYGQERIDKDYTLGNDGKYYRVVATSPTLKELGGDIGRAIVDITKGLIDNSLLGKILGLNEEEVKKVDVYKLTKEQQEKLEEYNSQQKDTTTTDTKKLTEEVTPRFKGGFGELMGVEEFGQLNRDIEVLGMNIDALQKNLDTITDRDEFKYQRGRLDSLERELKEKNKTLEKEKQKRQEITDNYNKLQKQKQEEQLQQIKEGKDTRQTYDKPRTQEQRQQETGQTQKQRESRTETTGKFERAKAGASVSGERLRGGI